MAGIFDLFKRKGGSAQQGGPATPKDAFFLSPDDAKTFGDIDYMRTPRTIKRTFAKTIDGGDIGESVKSISALEEKVLNPEELKTKKTNKSEVSFSSSETTQTNFSEERRPASTDIDIFRKMAGDINKKR